MHNITAKTVYLLVLLFSNESFGIELKSSFSAKFEQAVQKQVLMAGVELLLVKKGTERVISPSYQFKSGDQFRLRLRSSVNSEYSLYILDNEGQKVETQVVQGQVAAKSIVLVPSIERGVLALDGEPGIEWLQLVVRATGDLSDKPAKLLSNKHPHGKIEQIILRNVELQAPLEQQMHYDAVSKIIYFSRLKSTKESAQVSIKLGLTHTK